MNAHRKKAGIFESEALNSVKTQCIVRCIQNGGEEMSDVHVVIIGRFPEEIRTKIRGAFPRDWTVHVAAREEAGLFLPAADVVIPEHVPVSRELLDHAPKARMIQTGSGYDNVNLEECRRRGITVCTGAGVNADAVAEHTIALMLAWYKNIPYMDQCMKTHVPWEDISYAGAELSALTAGIVGAGRIGRKTADLCRAFGMRVLTYSRHHLPDCSDSPEQVSLDTLLQESDVVSIHVPLTEETKKMFHKGNFVKMKRSAVLINTSRGGVVKEEDLTEALQAGIIAGACLDVFSQEPLPVDSPLRDLPNVILTPHIAGLPDGVRYHARRFAFFAENICRFIKGDKPENCVMGPLFR